MPITMLRCAHMFMSPCIFCSYLMGFPCSPPSMVAGLYFFKQKNNKSNYDFYSFRSAECCFLDCSEVKS